MTIKRIVIRRTSPCFRVLLIRLSITATMIRVTTSPRDAIDIVRIGNISDPEGSLVMYRITLKSMSEVIPVATNTVSSTKSESRIANWGDLNLGTQVDHSCPICKSDTDGDTKRVYFFFRNWRGSELAFPIGTRYLSIIT